MPPDGPLAAGDLTPGGLTGRDGDTARLRLTLDNSRLVTVTGLPGVGKTAVALEAAVAAAGAYADGSLLLRLDGLSDEALLPHTIAAVLQLDDDFAASRLEVLVDQLRDRHMLIVLDTCEHLLGACAGLIAALLPRCPKVQFLATSREPLRVPGESVVAIRPLRLVDAMTLFSQRAAAAGLVTGPEHRATIASICVQLDKLPLAIELASAGLAGLGEPPAAVLGGLLARLERGEDVLGAAGAAPAQPVQGPPVQGMPVQGQPVQGQPVQARHGEPRQRSMRTAIGWSHELCTPAERLLWARLSVFGGPFTLRAAQDVCATSQLPDEAIEAGLALLTERSVLLALGPDGAGPRFALPVTLRVYGGQMLRRLGQEQEFEDRYRRWQQTLTK
jgi:predicted ATPase